MKQAIAALLIMAVIGYISPNTLITTLLFSAGIAVNALVRSASMKEDFKWPVLFHKGCANIHWAFISFYVFSFGSLRTDLGRFTPMFFLIVTLVLSGALYMIGGLTTEKVLADDNPGFLRTRSEIENASAAAISLCVALVFARFLTRT